MKIIAFPHTVPFIQWTIDAAIFECSEQFKAEHVAWSKQSLEQKRIDGDSSSDVLVIFEIGHPQHCGITAEQMREFWPNAKFIALASDTIYYMVNGLKPQLNPALIDIYMELMPQCTEWLYKNGANYVINWHWGLSELLITEAKEFAFRFPSKKEYDFIGVYHPGSIREGTQRGRLVSWIKENSLTFTNGGGNGHDDQDMDRLFSHYVKSKFTLGTSSHNLEYLTELGCKKGFRDDLGPILGAPLIYDYHQNLWSDYPDMVMPLYDYHNLDSIKYILKGCTGENYEYLLNNQREWIQKNSLTNQLRYIINEFI